MTKDAKINIVHKGTQDIRIYTSKDAQDQEMLFQTVQKVSQNLSPRRHGKETAV